MFFQRAKTVKVKICGIKNKLSARQAVDAGADALGFVFARESRRFIDPLEAREIILELPPKIQTVGVFVDTPAAEINRIADLCNLDIVQLHDDKKICHHTEIKLPVIKCLRIKNQSDPNMFCCAQADAVLLDTYHPRMAGGTGKSFNWSIAANININKPLILAGGLTPDNIKAAIKTVRPCAVDVSSGVETNGVKDASKIKSFIKRAKEVQL